MLESFIFHKQILSDFYNAKMPHDPILEENWEMAICVKDFLQFFYDATNDFQVFITQPVVF